MGINSVFTLGQNLPQCLPTTIHDLRCPAQQITVLPLHAEEHYIIASTKY